MLVPKKSYSRVHLQIHLSHDAHEFVSPQRLHPIRVGLEDDQRFIQHHKRSLDRQLRERMDDI